MAYIPRPSPPTASTTPQSRRVDLRHILSSLETTACTLMRSKVVKLSAEDTARFIAMNFLNTLYSAESNFRSDVSALKSRY
jgi:hypothetical protein